MTGARRGMERWIACSAYGCQSILGDLVYPGSKGQVGYRASM